MIAWGLVWEAVTKNKWMAYLALIVALFYFMGNTVVSCVAYFQPKVTIIHTVIEKTVHIDKTVTEERQIRRPDGTIEMLKLVHTDIRKLSLKDSRDASVKEPVALGASKLILLPGLQIWPVERRLDLGLGIELGSLQVGAGHKLFHVERESVILVNSFNPSVRLDYRWGVGK